MEREIAAATRGIADAEHSGDREYVDALVDDECEHIEELLGLAFVAAQSFITNIRSRVATMAEVCNSAFHHPLTCATDPKAFDLLKLGQPMGTRVRYTAVEAINAVANYWKHEADWQTNDQRKNRKRVPLWDPDSMPKHRRTVEIVMDLGLSPGSSGNLRTAVQALGVQNFEDLSPIRERLRCWAHDVYERLRAETASVERERRE